MGRRASKWWASRTPAQRRAELAKQRRNKNPATAARSGADFMHHYMDDLACPACGTDSSVGCIAEINHG